MASITIDIELDPGPWAEPELRDYHAAGGELSGTVIVSTDEVRTCRAVRVSVGWHTEGRGDRDEENLYEQTLHEGRLQVGGQSFPFRMQLPHEPLSYTGTYVSVCWHVEARVDLAWRRDPVASHAFYVVLPPVG